MKPLPTRGKVVPLSDHEIARLRTILNKDSNVIFVDFGGK